LMLASAAAAKDEGNAHFRRKDYDRAIRLYSEGLALLEAAGGVEHTGQITQTICAGKLQGTLYANRSECHLRRQQWVAAKDDADAALACYADTPESSVLKQKARRRLRVRLHNFVLF
jgi:tetratricopeptide (TPR) repeat protein